MPNTALEERKINLVQDIEKYRERFHKSRRKHSILYYVLVVSGIGLSALAGAGSFTDYSSISGIIPFLVTVSISLETAFNFGEKNHFYRVLVRECENLKIALRYRVDDDDKLKLILEKFQVVIDRSARSLPRGQGMNSVKTLYEDLDRKGILIVPEIE